MDCQPGDFRWLPQCSSGVCISNESILVGLNVKPQVMKMINERKCRYLGHIVRGERYEYQCLLLEGTVDGKRGRGRPRNTLTPLPPPKKKWPNPTRSQDNPRVIIKSPKIWPIWTSPPSTHTHTHTHTHEKKSLATGLETGWELTMLLRFERHKIAISGGPWSPSPWWIWNPWLIDWLFVCMGEYTRFTTLRFFKVVSF